MGVIADEASRIASSTVSTSQKAVAEAQKIALSNEAVALSVIRVKLQISISDLALALGGSAAQKVVDRASGQIADSIKEIKKANDLIKTANEALKSP